MNKIKKRRITWKKKSNNLTTVELSREKLKLLRQIEKARKDGYRVIYLDETMFTKAALPQSEYCLPKENVNIDKSQAYEPAMALLSGISKEKGLEHYMLFPRSVNIQKFKDYLIKLREVNGDAKICLFMDNLATHISPKIYNFSKFSRSI